MSRGSINDKSLDIRNLHWPHNKVSRTNDTITQVTLNIVNNVVILNVEFKWKGTNNNSFYHTHICSLKSTWHTQTFNFQLQHFHRPYNIRKTWPWWIQRGTYMTSPKLTHGAESLSSHFVSPKPNKLTSIVTLVMYSHVFHTIPPWHHLTLSMTQLYTCSNCWDLKSECLNKIIPIHKSRQPLHPFKGQRNIECSN